jgi:N-acetylglucosaminyldiphosphoundecaprenol N-acetyl-beta-D-mannosaminyltransferase
MEAQRRPDFRKVLERAILVAPDGMPTVWVGKWQGHAQMQRVFGPDLMRQLCRRSQTTGYTHFLFGGRPGVAGELEANLKRWFPEIRILGTYTPPFGPLSCQEQSELENKLAALAPDIIWVGLSTPKQELFMAANLARLRCRVMIGVGAAFDIHTGRLQDSPDWVKIAGLQWLHRLAQEPWRLWRRYLVNNSTFLWRLAFQLTRLRNYDLGPTNTTRDET